LNFPVRSKVRNKSNKETMGQEFVEKEKLGRRRPRSATEHVERGVHKEGQQELRWSRGRN
jgi:hypothetical protein